MRYAFLVRTGGSANKKLLADFLSAEPGVVEVIDVDRMGPPRLTVFVEAAAPSQAKTLLGAMIDDVILHLGINAEVCGDGVT